MKQRDGHGDLYKSSEPDSTNTLGSSDHGSDGISMWTAVAIVVAAMVGTGVYAGIGYQVEGIPSAFPVLLIWVLGGFWAWCGAMCYAELAAMFPRSGGEYNLLGKAMHPFAGFLAGWVSLVAGFVAPAALGASMFGVYVDGIFNTTYGRYAAVAVLVFVTLVQLGPLRVSSYFLHSLTWLKVALIVLIIAVAFGWAESTNVGFLPKAGDGKLITSQAFGVSAIFVTYAYTGWNASTYIVGEVRDPQRNVPRSLFIGIAIVTLLYVGLNAAFLHATPIETIRAIPMGEREGAALVAAESIFGESGGRIIAGIIGIGLVSFVSSMLWAGPRVAEAIGQDYRSLAIVAKPNRFGVPGVAVVLSACIAIGLLLLNQFRAVITYTQFVLVLCNLLTVVAMVWLRIRRPDLPRPFRAWGYPLIPVLFLLMCAALLVHTFASDYRAALWGMVTLALPVPLYLWERQRKA